VQSLWKRQYRVTCPRRSWFSKKGIAISRKALCRGAGFGADSLAILDEPS
jgi:hypothetical protein